MSDDEEVMHSEEEEGSEEEDEPQPTRTEQRPAYTAQKSEEEEEQKAEDTGPSEAQAAMEKRRQQQSHGGLDDDAEELLENNRQERQRMEEEINEMRHRSEQRKKEREQEEKRLAQQRIEEDARRKAEEEERRGKKESDERKKKEARAAKMAEFEKWKNPPTPNFVITKKERVDEGDEEEEEPKEEENKKTKEQLEAEKQATLKQRIQPLETSGFDVSKMTEKAKELHTLLYRLESEKYDLERRFKAQQYDMMELAERARSMNTVGKQGSLKRIQLNEEDADIMQERFAGCPARVIMYSEYERQKDKRDFVLRRGIYTGPVYGFPAERIRPQRIVKWNEEGLPLYEETDEAAPAQEEVPVEGGGEE